MHDLTASPDQMVRAVLAAIEGKVVTERAADHMVRAPPGKFTPSPAGRVTPKPKRSGGPRSPHVSLLPVNAPRRRAA